MAMRFYCDLCGAEIKMARGYSPIQRALPWTSQGKPVWSEMDLCEPCRDIIRSTVDGILETNKMIDKTVQGALPKVKGKKGK